MTHPSHTLTHTHTHVPSEEVEEDKAERLYVVPPALLNAHVCVDAFIPRSPCQLLVLAVCNVLPRPRVTVLLRKPKVDYVNLRVYACVCVRV